MNNSLSFREICLKRKCLNVWKYQVAETLSESGKSASMSVKSMRDHYMEVIALYTSLQRSIWNEVCMRKVWTLCSWKWRCLRSDSVMMWGKILLRKVRKLLSLPGWWWWFWYLLKCCDLTVPSGSSLRLHTLSSAVWDTWVTRFFAGSRGFFGF